jgi:hypothetical protein
VHFSLNDLKASVLMIVPAQSKSPQAEQTAAEKMTCSVILSAAKNLSSI